MKTMSFAKNPRTLFLTLLGLAAAASVLGLLVYREWDAFVAYDWQLNWWALAAAYVLLLIGVAIPALGWAIIMRIMGSQLPLLMHLRYYVITYLTRRLPGTVWYVAGRGYLYRQEGESLRLVTIASSVEYALQIVAGALVTLALWSYALRGVSLWYAVGLGLLALLGLWATQPQIMRWYLRRVGLQDAPALRKRHVLGLLALYAVLWLVGGLMFYAIAFAVTAVAPVHMVYIIACWCLVGTLSVVVFFLPSNFGFTEVGLSLLLSAVMPSSLAVLVAVLSRLFTMGFELLAVAVVLPLLAWIGRSRAD
jgi:uncharacterized membrane protein YbhN (UPF0104 family)